MDNLLPLFVEFGLSCYAASLSHYLNVYLYYPYYTFKKLKVSAKNAIYVGDMVHDFTAAKRAKTNFILAKYGYLNKKIKTNYAIDNIKGLEKILKKF